MSDPQGEAFLNASETCKLLVSFEAFFWGGCHATCCVTFQKKNAAEEASKQSFLLTLINVYKEKSLYDITIY